MIEKIFRYGLIRRIRSGIRLKIYPSFECSLNCWYCGNGLEGNTNPKDPPKIYELEDWQELISNFPIKINDVVLSGGEPTIYKDFVPLANWILDQGIMLEVYTNLTNKRLAKVRPSYKLRILATYHHEYDMQKFNENYLFVQKQHKHKIDVKEIGSKKLTYSRLVPWGCTLESSKQVFKNYLYCCPDGEIFTCCYKAMLHATKNQKKVISRPLPEISENL